MRLRVVCAVLAASLGLAGARAYAAPAQQVLVLNSYHPQYEWTAELVRGLRDELAFLPPENLHIEFMDARRMVDDEHYLELLAALYAHKYARFRPDIIISSDDSALTFLLERRNELFADVPVVFCGINSRSPTELEQVDNMTGILEGLDVAGNLELIERLHPNAKRVVLLADRTSLGQGMTRVARSVMPRFERPTRRLEIWDDFTLQELGARMAAVDADTVFLLLAIHEDRAGRYFSFTEDLKPLTQRTRSPVYAMFGMLLGLGVAGGMMNDPYEHGRATGAMALRVLEGTPADAIPVVPSAVYRPRFDYPELQRVHVDLSALPPGSTVIRRPVSFYEQHTALVWSVSGAFLVLLVTIAWLTRLIARMRRAERELVAHQEELRRSQQLKLIGTLAGGIAHDFNNLITAISCFATLAQDASRDDAQLRDYLDQIQRAGARAANLTRQLLSFARRQPVEPRVIDLNTVVVDMHKLLRRLVSEAVEFVTLPASEPAFVLADRGQLEQVLSNLVTNARDAMPRGGKLTIQVSVTPTEVELRTTDTGSGMSDEVKAKIFEPFYTTKEVGRGTGLGLATAHSIIEQARGSIDVESAPGKGSTFTVRLPRVLEQPSTAHSEPPALQDVEPGLVLLAEDDPQVRRVAARALEARGFQVLEAENGAEALELAEHNVGRLSCVLTDVVMPIMGGVEFLRQLRLVDADVPAVVMSGYVDDASILVDARELGARFIAKPFLPADLVAAVSEAMRPGRGAAEPRNGTQA